MLAVDWGYRQLPCLGAGHLSFILQFITQSPQCKSLILCIKGTITDFEFVTSAYIKLFALNSSDA